jgi:hypothetical protein
VRLAENSPDSLVLRDRSALLALLLLGAAVLMAVSFLLVRGQAGLLVVAAFFAVCGLAFLRTSTVVFDKGSRTCFIRRRDIFKVTERAVPFSEITNVRLDQSSGGEMGTTSTFRVTLVTQAEDVPLSAVYEAGRAKYEAMREALVDILFDSRARPAEPDPVEGMLKSGRIIDATAFLRRRDGLGLTEAKTRVDELRKLHGV